MIGEWRRFESLQEQKDFFISYNEADRTWAEWVAWQLEEEGYTTILQAWDFQPGTNFPHLMDKATRITKRTILVLSPDSLDGPFTISEWTVAFKRDPIGENRILVPIRVRECKPEGLLGNIVYIDLINCNEAQAQQKLIAGIKERAKPTHKPAFPGTDQQRSVVTKPDFPPAQEEPSIGTTLYTYDIHPTWINAVAWSPDGTRIASGGGDAIVRIWDAYTGQHRLTYRGHWSQFMARVWDARWSPDGTYIASCGFGSTVRVWEAATGRDVTLYNEQKSLDPTAETYAIAWSVDGRRVVSACSSITGVDTIHIWNALTGHRYLKYSGHVKNILDLFSISALAWSPNGQYIASSGIDKTVKQWKLSLTGSYHTVHIWNATTSMPIAISKDFASWIYDLSWSPDSRYIASAENNKKVRIWDATNGDNVLTYEGHTKEVRAVAWSPDGTCIVSAGNDHLVHLWHAATGKLLYIYRGHMDNVTALAWSPNKTHIASGSADKTVRVWKAN